MALKIWQKKYILRRYGSVTNSNGYGDYTHTDTEESFDIQTTAGQERTAPDGDYTLQRIKAFGDFPVTTARDGGKADRIWFQNRWFECVASRLSDNTIIGHYTSEFCECIDQEESPEEEE